VGAVACPANNQPRETVVIINAQQVREKLRIGDARLRTLVEQGKLKPTNQRKPGAKKFFMRFDSRAVAAAAKELGLNGHAPRRERPVPFSAAQGGGLTGILTRLARIEETVQAIAKALL
jgi:hypothetical protein